MSTSGTRSCSEVLGPIAEYPDWVERREKKNNEVCNAIMYSVRVWTVKIKLDICVFSFERKKEKKKFFLTVNYQLNSEKTMKFVKKNFLMKILLFCMPPIKMFMSPVKNIPTDFSGMYYCVNFVENSVSFDFQIFGPIIVSNFFFF